MAEYIFNDLTKNGLDLKTRADLGNSSFNLQITRMAVGSGILLDGIDPYSLTDLIHYENDLILVSFKNHGNGQSSVTGELSNSDVTTGFSAWEFGIFAYDPDANKEILYSYIYASNPNWIAPFNTTPETSLISVETITGVNANLTMVIDAIAQSTQISYDNTGSGLEAGTTQEAIDKLSSKVVANYEDYKNFENSGAGKNWIINGNFQVWQRGDSFHVTAPSKYTADRFIFEATRPGVIVDIKRGSNSMILTPQATVGAIYTYQYIENAFAGQTVTFSCKARILSGNPNNPCIIHGIEQPITLTNEYQTFAHTYSFPANRTGNTGVGFRFDATLGDSIEMTDWKVEIGDRPTPFISKLFQEELRDCLYYFERKSCSNHGETFTDAQSLGVNQNQVKLLMKYAEKRQIPSITLSHSLNYYIVEWINQAIANSTSPTIITSLTFANATLNGVFVVVNAPIINAYGTVYLSNNSPTVYIDIDAEI